MFLASFLTMYESEKKLLWSSIFWGGMGGLGELTFLDVVLDLQGPKFFL